LSRSTQFLMVRLGDLPRKIGEIRTIPDLPPITSVWIA
jgi:hypothetical protein